MQPLGDHPNSHRDKDTVQHDLGDGSSRTLAVYNLRPSGVETVESVDDGKTEIIQCPGGDYRVVTQSQEWSQQAEPADNAPETWRIFRSDEAGYRMDRTATAMTTQ